MLLAFAAAVLFAPCVLLVVGAVKKWPGCLVPWLILNATGACWMQMERIVDYALVDKFRVPTEAHLAVSVVSFLLSLLFWLVVYSLHRQLEMRQKYTFTTNRHQSHKV